jgi:hypothetical protein
MCGDEFSFWGRFSVTGDGGDRFLATTAAAIISIWAGGDGGDLILFGGDGDTSMKPLDAIDDVYIAFTSFTEADAEECGE